MADFDHTLESSSAQEKPSYIINLIVQEIFASTPKGIGSLAMSVIPSQYDPCIILQGEWLRKLGFERGDPIRVLAESNLLRVMPGYSFSEANAMVKVDTGGTVSHADFMEELDGIKAEKGDTIGCNDSSKDCDRDDSKKEGGNDGGRGRDKDRAEKAIKKGATSDDEGDVLTGVNSELDND